MTARSVTFRLTAYSDAAGKYSPEAPLNGNEDNFFVDGNIGDTKGANWQTDREQELGPCGCLLMIADGMGGMNAGEVASAIAVATVASAFAPGNITTEMASSHESRKKYLEKVIVDADKAIKTDAAANPDHAGMGSTIIMAWIMPDEVTVSWCGDSRAYRFNPLTGLEPLSTDHSYVQELANKGIISYDDTFSHPQGNIVTRSLGDPTGTAKPESRLFPLYNHDIILLCSDGLSGVLRDRKTLDHNGRLYPGENIEDIIAANCASLTTCRDALMAAAERADWYDNVTILLFEVVNGAPLASNSHREVGATSTSSQRWKRIATAAIIIGIVLVGVVIWLVAGMHSSETSTAATADSTVLQSDTVPAHGADNASKQSSQNPQQEESVSTDEAPAKKTTKEVLPIAIPKTTPTAKDSAQSELTPAPTQKPNTKDNPAKTDKDKKTDSEPITETEK